jgi:hypothetical protein
MLACAIGLAFAPAIARAQDADEVTRYDNSWEISGGMSYFNTVNGPHIAERSNLAGANVSATQWLYPRLGATGDIRGYLGTGNALPNPYGVSSPLVQETLFSFGPEYRLVRRPSFGVSGHVLIGGGYGIFDLHVPSYVPQTNIGLYPNGGTFDVIAGGNIDLNRTPQVAIRLTPEYVATHFGGQIQNSFSLTLGAVWRFGKF